MPKSLVALALAGLLALSACGSSTGTDSTGSASAEASSAASKHIDPDNFAHELIDAMQKTGTFVSDSTSSVDFNGQTITSTVHIEYDMTDPQNMKVHVTSNKDDGQTMETIMIGKTVYMKLPGADKWSSRTAETAEAAAALTLPEDTTATEIGPETINGIETTHYQVMNPILGSPMDYWIDTKGRPVRTTIESINTDYSGFGEPVNIQAPDPSEVTQG